jgi:membrane-associated phospholipid phosphatase
MSEIRDSYSTKKCLLALGGVFAVLMAVFAFFDLDISLALVNMESSFGKFAEWASEIPLDFLVMMSFAVLFMGLLQKKKNFWRILGAVICLIGTLEYGFFIFFFSVKYASTKLALILGGTLGTLMAVAALFAAKKLLALHRDEVMRAALIVVVTVLLQELFVNGLKSVWDRPRMRDLAAPYTDFMPWFKPHSSVLGGDSFPSGHTSKAAGACLYVLLCDVFEKLKGKRVYFLAAGLLWTVLIGVGRIVLAAHFASDVTAGAFFMLLAFLLARALTDSVLLKKKGGNQ